MVHGEDLDRLYGGRGSSVHFVWGHRTQQDRPEQGPANNAIPMQPSYILFVAEQEASARCRAYIGRDVVIFGYATNETGCRAQNAIQAA